SKTAVFLHPGAQVLGVGALLFALASRRGVKPEALRGGIAVDPLGFLVGGGDLVGPLDAAYDDMAVLTRAAILRAPRLHTVVVSGLSYRDAGASATQELAYVIATAVAYVRVLRDRGLAPEETAPHIRLCFDVGSNFFLEIAKLRAARLLWSQVMAAYGVDPARAKAHLHARTARWNKSALDPHVNMLRGTTEAFAAVVGGVDSLQVDPFDAPLRDADVFSRRVARNTQLVLAEECELTHVADPAGGSYYVEWLTDRVARRAWEIFQGIEAAGGMARALEGGIPQDQVAEAAKDQVEAVATRRHRQVGVNIYPLAGEVPLASRDDEASSGVPERHADVARQRAARGDVSSALDAFRDTLDRGVAGSRGISESAVVDAVVVDRAVDAFAAGATLGELAGIKRDLQDGPVSAIEALSARRLAGDFEALRRAARAYADKHGEEPMVFQANLGPSRRYRARADWTTALFQVGGFAVSCDVDFEDADALVLAARERDAKIVVLCADDARYVAELPGLTKGLHAALPEAHLLLAGTPGDKEAAWRGAG
ncbi:MAG: acyl-CoA mutase large subunit family protein, partial [Deltaproteobacteria bacterium]|nr:acyl-CoA mutase large subunit family protein [Deltaproteobacteria bacterium]